ASDTATHSLSMIVNPVLVPAVAISSGSGNSVCAGDPVIFTATPTNGGTLPSYQWKVNGTNTGTNSNTYSTAVLANNDIVTCVMTSSYACVSSSTASSNAITMTVHNGVAPAVTISANPGNTVCAGTSVTFTATP